MVNLKDINEIKYTLKRINKYKTFKKSHFLFNKIILKQTYNLNKNYVF